MTPMWLRELVGGSTGPGCSLCVSNCKEKNLTGLNNPFLSGISNVMLTSDGALLVTKATSSNPNIWKSTSQFSTRPTSRRLPSARSRCARRKSLVCSASSTRWIQNLLKRINLYWSQHQKESKSWFTPLTKQLCNLLPIALASLMRGLACLFLGSGCSKVPYDRDVVGSNPIGCWLLSLLYPNSSASLIQVPHGGAAQLIFILKMCLAIQFEVNQA